jgi:hypothetical protein
MSQGMNNPISLIRASMSAQPYGWALGVFIAFRVFAFAYFNGNYIDSDQCVLAQQAEDFSRGFFFSPYFYGQGYNLSIEAALAAPLIQFGLNPLWALPLVTAVLSAMPWVLFSQIPSDPKQKAWVLLSSFLWPISYTQISLLPRGFVQGIALASIGLFAFFKQAKGRWAWLTFFGSFALLANPNSVLLLAAAMPFIFSEFRLRAVGSALAGILPVVGIFWALKALSPDLSRFWVHSNPNLSWSTTMVLENLRVLPDSLLHLIWFPGWAGLAVGAAILTWLLLRFGVLKAGLALLAALLLAMGSAKLADGTANIFYSYGRFFLAIPPALAFSFAVGKPSKKFSFHPVWLPVMAIYAFGLWHFSSIRHFGNVYCPVMVYHRATFQEHAREVLQASESSDCIIVGNHWVIEAGSQGFGLVEDLPPSFRPVYERRLFELLPLLDKPVDEILLLDIELDKRPEVRKHPDLSWTEIPSGLGPLFQIRTNREKSLREVLQILQLSSPNWDSHKKL